MYDDNSLRVAELSREHDDPLILLFIASYTECIYSVTDPEGGYLVLLFKKIAVVKYQHV